MLGTALSTEGIKRKGQGWSRCFKYVYRSRIFLFEQRKNLMLEQL